MEDIFVNRYRQCLLGLIFITNSVISGELAPDPGQSQAGMYGYEKVINVSAEDALNMRAAPGSDTPILAKLAPGTIILRLGKHQGWVRVMHQGQTGWVYGKYLGKTDPPELVDADLIGLVCTGTEPHWKLTADSSRVSYGMYGEKRDYVLDSAVTPALNYQGLWYVSAYSPGSAENDYSSHISMTIQSDSQCSDDMSETRYDFSIILFNADHQLLKGCCKQSK